MSMVQEWLVKRQERLLHKRIQQILKKEGENRKQVLEGLVKLEQLYVMEDEQGKEYTKERMETMTTEELTELLEHYNEQMKKEHGE